MKSFDEPDDPRRRLLLEALASGLFAAGIPGSQALANVLGGIPRKLGPEQSIYRLRGKALVNNREVTRETRIAPGDTVRTDRDSEIIFVVGADAMLLRDDSEVVLASAKKAADPKNPEQIAGLKLTKGKLLTVFAPGSRKLQTATASILIKGTGIYMESEPDESYVCTCYGLSEISATDDPQSKETVAATHHDKPLYIVAGSKSSGNSIRRAPFKNHTDHELEIIEALVGRSPPFGSSGPQYEAPRRDY